MGRFADIPEMPSKQPDLTDLHARARARAFMSLVDARRWFLPVIALALIGIAIDDGTPWRMAVLLTAGCIMLTLVVADVAISRRVRRESLELLLERPVAPLLVLQVVVITLVQSLAFAGTGGMASPLLPGCLPVVFLSSIFLSARATWSIVTMMVAVLWGMALVHTSVSLTPTAFAFADGHAVQPPTLAVTLAGVMTLMLMLSAKLGTLTRTAIDEMVSQALQARDSALASHAVQARELTTLSAEIAHELKNPLASIKGLAALIDRELAREPQPESSKSLERLGVLRREVDRMQGILDEFLNFSRPLVPLAQRDVSLRSVVEHVVELHEALAAERRVQLSVHGEARAHCDPRKVEQIVINLVQNALHVAPRGSTIELRLEQAGEHARLCVRDQGPGIEPELREQVFEPGVTSKGDGSGLGLTVARALARQHGGELELGPCPNATTGCEAVLELPVAASERGAA